VKQLVRGRGRDAATENGVERFAGKAERRLVRAF
jgi:hypothetical protein